MLLYGIIILVSIALVTTLNAFFNPIGLPWYHYLIATLIYTVVVIILDGVVAGIYREIKKKCIKHDNRFYLASQKEQLFYRRIGVQKWKDHIPELGQFTGFHKSSVINPRDNTYIKRYIMEICYGIAGHFWSMPLSFLIIFIDWRMWSGASNLWITIAIPVAVVSVVLNFLPYVVLRYNLPKLKNLYAINLRDTSHKAA